MSDAGGADDDLTPPEARVRSLLGDLREERVPDGHRLTAAVTRTLRWQRPMRRALAGVGGLGASFFDGVAAYWRGRRR